MSEERNHRSRTLILSDFDGTVSVKDTVAQLVREHAVSRDWRFHVKRYLRGEIGSRGVYEAVAPLMRMTPADLDSFVDRQAELDPDFPAFLQWASEQGIDVKIVSDGFDAVIRTLFRKHGIEGLEIYANELIPSDDGTVTMRSPHHNPACGDWGTCKASVVSKLRPDYDRIIFIGDGESDREAVKEADVVLALHDLFIYCARENLPALRIDGFRDVPRLLSRRIRAVAYDMDGTLIDSIDTIAECFNHMFRELGYPTMTTDEVARKTTMALTQFVEANLRPDERERGVKIFRDYYDTIFLEKTRFLPGAREVLESLDGTYISGIITNKRGTYARQIARHLGIEDRMTRIIGAQDGFKPKPSADMFIEFMRDAGTDPSDTVYVGDTPSDIKAARKAGVDAIAVASSVFPAEELALHKPRAVAASITDVLRFLRLTAIL